jgi:hypothetical protein
MRRFGFEADIYETLSCVPMMVREKLDHVAIKISLEQWLKFALHERRQICALPIDTARDLRKLSDLIRRLVREHCGEEPSTLSADQRQAAFPTLELPAHLAANASALGFNLSRESWTLLAADERYALLKLGGGRRVRRNFEAALKEFLQGRESEYTAGLAITTPAPGDEVVDASALGLLTPIPAGKGTLNG